MTTLQIERECGNADCGWKGMTDRMLGSVGPLCPRCGETTEPASYGSNAPDVAARLIQELHNGTANKDPAAWMSEAAITMQRLTVDANGHTTGPLPFARAVLALTSAPAEPQNAQTHLEDIYAYLCSIAPNGIADEAFRNVPETILAASVRNRIAQSRPEVGAESSPVHGHAGAARRANARNGKPVAAPAETPQAAGAIDARVRAFLFKEYNKDARTPLQIARQREIGALLDSLDRKAK